MKNIKQFFFINLVLILLLMMFSCKNSSENDNPDIKNDYAKVTFFNNTQFYVKVYRDTFIMFFEELKPGESNIGEIQESLDYNVGTTFRFSYRYKLSDPDDSFSGEPFADGIVGDFEETFVIRKDKDNIRNIPIPNNITFNDAFIRVKNNISYNVFLRRIGSAVLQLGNSEMMIPAGKTGIYRIRNADNMYMGDYSLINVEIPFNFPEMTLSAGYVYDFILTDEGISPRIISDTKWKIKPEPTTTWKKDITGYYATNFSNANSKLNIHLRTVVRDGISKLRSNYPLNKIIYNNGSLISGEWGYGVIPIIVQQTGIAEVYEIPVINVKDSEWENSIIPTRNIYAGTMPIAYHTTFNDIIKLGQNYVILSTYSNNLRTGLWLSFLNEQGLVVDERDIAPDSNGLDGFIGTKLVKLDDNAFLVLGSKRTYSAVTDELFTDSSSIIYKYQYGSTDTVVWSTEYRHPLHFANSLTCGLELPDSYIVCGYAGDNISTKYIILKINKDDGDTTLMQTFGVGNESWRPFSIGIDNEGFIYITGIATEGVNSRAYIQKLDSSYQQIWLQKYGNMYDNFLFDINITGNLLTAVGSGNDGSVFDPSFYGWQAGKGWIIRIDTNTGIVLKEIFNEVASAFNSIVRLDDDGFVISAIKSVDASEPYWFNSFIIKVNEHLLFEE